MTKAFESAVITGAASGIGRALASLPVHRGVWANLVCLNAGVFGTSMGPPGKGRR